MQTLSRVVLEAGLGGRVLRDRQLRDCLQGSDQRRYNLVNRALHAGELIRLARGLYVLDPELGSTLPHAFVVAQALRPGSFVSFESALGWHGWIPESVPLHVSVVPGRRRVAFSAPVYGEFRFVPLALQPGYGLAGVRRVELAGGVALIADPLRALLDLACWRKIEPDALGAFLRGLRLSSEFQEHLNTDGLVRFREVYRHRRVQRVIDELEEMSSIHD